MKPENIIYIGVVSILLFTSIISMIGGSFVPLIAGIIWAALLMLFLVV